MENPDEGALRRQPPARRPQEYYRGNFNIVDPYGPLFLPPLPQGHSFVVTSSLMQMLTARGLFSRLPSSSTCSHCQTKVSVQELCREDGLGHGYHWIKGVPSLTYGRDHNLV